MKNKKILIISLLSSLVLTIALVLLFGLMKDGEKLIKYSLSLPLLLLSLSFVFLNNKRINNIYLILLILYLFAFGFINYNFSRLSYIYIPYAFLVIYLSLLGILKYINLNKENEKMNKVIDIMSYIILLPYLVLFTCGVINILFGIIFGILILLVFCLLSYLFDKNIKKEMFFSSFTYLALISALNSIIKYENNIIVFIVFILLVLLFIFNSFIFILTFNQGKKIFGIEIKEISTKLIISFISLNGACFLIYFIVLSLCEYL